MRARVFASFLIISIIVVFAGPLHAEEGMWMLHTIGDLPLDRMKAKGLSVTPADIFDQENDSISKAVVRLGGGTASFVSDKGLLITNHHVAFAALQKQATAETNYMRDGFWAKEFSQEIPAKGYLMYSLERYEEITDKVLAGVSGDMQGIERFKKIDLNKKKLIEKAEAESGLRCEIYSVFEGLRYYLFYYFEIKDVRIVYAPPFSIGSYGGDIDNWMWPRHAGDFAFMRAYVGPDGKSANYSKDNVSYKPKRYLKISTAGVTDGEFTFIIGYPYRTERYRSSFATDSNVNFELPWKVRILEDMADIYQKAGKADEKVKVIVANRLMGIMNYHKNYKGTLDGLVKVDLLSTKKRDEATILKRLKGDALADYKNALDGLDRLYNQDYAAYKKKEAVIDWMGYFNWLPRFAITVNEWSEQKQLDDLAREEKYQTRNLERLKRRLEISQRDLHVETDKKIFRMFLKRALALPANQRITAIDKALKVKNGKMPSDSQIDKFIDKLYGGTKLHDLNERKQMFDLSRDELLSRNDSFINFAVKLQKERDELLAKHKAFSGKVAKLRPAYIKGMIGDGPAYPDANGSTRFSYGVIQGYSPRDAVYYKPFTTMKGLLDKHTGKEPFNVPDKLLDAYLYKEFDKYRDKTLQDVPVCFTTTHDGTGGNSGSPVINGRGELVGLIFDTNFEAIMSDYAYDRDLNRSINVDIRYMMFVLDKVYKVRNVLDELELAD